MGTRNEERLGVQNPNAGDATAPVAAEQAPQRTGGLDFNFAMPTEFVELPSRGKFYPQNHPLREQESVEIRHMTTKEEDILNSETLIKQGKVFDRLISSVLVDKAIRPETLLIADKNALILALRIHNYGAGYNPSVTCPKCSANSEQNFDLRECKADYNGLDSLEEDMPLEVEATSRGTFLIKNLPISNWTFEVKTLTGVEEKKYTDEIERKKKAKLSEDILSTQISTFTVSIDEVTDIPTILKAVAALPAKDSRLLRNVYERIVPNLDMKQQFTCHECDHSERINLPFTADFFWSNS